MKLTLSAKAPKADVCFVLLKKGEKLSSATKTVLGPLAKEASARMKSKDFEGEEGQSVTLYGDAKSYKKVVLLGTGEPKKRMPGAMEEIGGKVAGMAKAAKAKKAAVIVDKKEFAEVAAGAALGSYEFTRYKKKEKKDTKLSEVVFVTDATKENKEALASLQVFEKVSPLTRDLVNTPAGDLTTKDLANIARQVGKQYGMKVTVFDDKKLAKLGCGAIVGVGQGAEFGARMVFIEYKHKTRSKQPNLAFLGKGVVFDTGGLNLKPTGYMETMKQDMAGAATVLGTMKAIAEAKLSGYFLGVLCCAENAVSDTAQRPGDVVKAYNGKTIEITNTDAEGRLCLADGLSYTEKNYKPKKMVNIATLTGAVSVALGYFITGVMGTDQGLVDDVLKAASTAQERAWQLPLDPDFKKATKGDFTDLKNSTSGVRAGATMGGAFLSNFVEDTPWAHFDIGGTAWAEKPSATTKYGSTSAMLRTFLELAKMNQG